MASKEAKILFIGNANNCYTLLFLKCLKCHFLHFESILNDI